MFALTKPVATVSSKVPFRQKNHLFHWVTLEKIIYFNISCLWHVFSSLIGLGAAAAEGRKFPLEYSLTMSLCVTESSYWALKCQDLNYSTSN